MASPMKVAVLGLNPVSEHVITLLQRFGFHLTCIWDRDIEQARKACSDHGIDVDSYFDYFPLSWKDVLISPNVELVFVANSPSEHAEVVVKALSVGRHVICQTPPSVNVEGVSRMLSMARYYPKLFGGLCSHFRFHPALGRAKELLDEDFCGNVVMMDMRIACQSLIAREGYSWKCSHIAGGGALNIYGSQLIDLIQYLSEERIEEVYGSLNTFYNQTDAIKGYRSVTSDDFCSAQVKCFNGVCASFVINCTLPEGFLFSLSISGSKGHLFVENMNLFGQRKGEERQLFYKADVTDTDYITFFDAGCSRMLSWLHGCLAMPSSSESSLKDISGQEVKDSVSMATFEDGLYIQRVISGIVRANETRKWCHLKEVESKILEEGDPFWHSSNIKGSLVSLDNQLTSKPPAGKRKISKKT